MRLCALTVGQEAEKISTLNLSILNTLTRSKSMIVFENLDKFLPTKLEA